MPIKQKNGKCQSMRINSNSTCLFITGASFLIISDSNIFLPISLPLLLMHSTLKPSMLMICPVNFSCSLMELMAKTFIILGRNERYRFWYSGFLKISRPGVKDMGFTKLSGRDRWRPGLCPTPGLLFWSLSYGIFWILLLWTMKVRAAL